MEAFLRVPVFRTFKPSEGLIASCLCWSTFEYRLPGVQSSSDLMLGRKQYRSPEVLDVSTSPISFGRAGNEIISNAFSGR